MNISARIRETSMRRFRIVENNVTSVITTSSV